MVCRVKLLIFSQFGDLFRQILIAPEPHHTIVVCVELSFFIELVYGSDLVVVFYESVCHRRDAAVFHEVEKLFDSIRRYRFRRRPVESLEHVVSKLHPGHFPYPACRAAVFVSCECLERSRVGRVFIHSEKLQHLRVYPAEMLSKILAEHRSVADGRIQQLFCRAVLVEHRRRVILEINERVFRSRMFFSELLHKCQQLVDVLSPRQSHVPQTLCYPPGMHMTVYKTGHQAFPADVTDIGICIFFHIQIRFITDEIYFFPAENYAVRSGIFFVGSIYVSIFYYRSHFCFPPLCHIIRRSSFQAAAL